MFYFVVGMMDPNFPLHKHSTIDRWQVHYSLTHPESIWREVWDWCYTTFGHPGTDPETGEESSWDYQGGWIYFYDEKYVTMYTLRWV